MARATPLVLASRSPRRRELLAAAGFEFEVVTPEVAELETAELTVRELTWSNARRKGRAAAAAQPEAVILAADTLVAIDGQVMGKPVDMNAARAMLRRLSGRTHEVCSAVFIVQPRTRREATFDEISHVTFRRLDATAITAYLAKVNPLDKAGAYAAQQHTSEIIDHIDGSYTNVVGLPMEKTLASLRQFGVLPRS